METKEYFEKVMQDYNQNRKGRSLRKYYQDAFLYAEQLLGKTFVFPQQEMTRRLFVLLR